MYVVVTFMYSTKIDDYVLLILRMDFGCSKVLYDWPSIVNQPVMDLGNDLLNGLESDADELNSNHIDKIRKLVLLPESAPHCEAKSLDVNVTLSRRGKIDDFINFIMTQGCYKKTLEVFSWSITTIPAHV